MPDDDAAQPPYLRFPHLQRDLVCFVAEDDVWVAPLTPGAPGGGRPGAARAAGGRDHGRGRAWRLTVDRTRVTCPRFSPDGERIAFTSWRSLDPEIHVVPVDGGPARRLTYWGAPEARVCGWTPEGDVLAVSSHEQPFHYRTWSYRLPTDGSPGSRLPWGPVADIAVAELGGVRRTLLLTGKPPHDPAAWKRYRGGATGRLWLHGERLLPELEGHLDSVMFVGHGTRIAFLSDHEGVGNLYSCRPDGTDLRRHSDHADFYARNAAGDGHRVVYQCGGDLWLVDDFSPSGRPRRLDITLGGPRAGRRTYQIPAAANLDALAADATGRASAVCVRGSLYWLTHRDGPARAISDTPGVRVRMPHMLGGTGKIAYVTDAAGEDAVEIADLPRATRTGPPRRIAAGMLGRVRELASAPDGRTLAVASHDGRLLLVDVSGLTGAEDVNGTGTGAGTGTETGTEAGTEEDAAEGDESGEGVRELIRSENGPVHDLSFSPDSRWLTWAHPGVGRSLSQIKIAQLETGNLIDVTDGRFEDEQPVFTRDGRYLAFLSWRGFDPVYDVHTGDLSFPLGCRPYLVPLSSATPSPFALAPEGRPAAGGLDPQDPVAGEDGPVLVEAEGLASRVTPFPVTASKYSSLAAVSGGGLIWLRHPISGALGETFANPADTSGRPTLEHFDPATAKRTELSEDADWFSLSGDGSRIVVGDDDELRAVPAAETAEEETTTWIDLRRVLHDVDPAAEWRQAYEEAGRIVRAYFWEPRMCGIDWTAVLDQYRPLVRRVASPDEFADLLREVLGELGTSHAYVTPARRDEGPAQYRRPIGLLGADLARTPSGEWHIQRILPGDSSDSKARSPLAGTGVREGAVLTHIDGREVDAVAGPWPLLAAAGGTTVELGFTQPEPEPGGDGSRVHADGNGRAGGSGDAGSRDAGLDGRADGRADGRVDGNGRTNPDGQPPRRVAVLPLVDDRSLRYQDWVARRRAVVRELSAGRCGYLHIPDMGGSGWAQFNRDLRMEVSRPALIIDVRGNAGGHISELVVETLTRTILGWDLTRDAQPVSYAGNAPRGPVVALADEMTSSDGDMITAAFRLLGLGPVVGARTWGGVVGVTGRHRLVDGTTITVPMHAAWFDAYGWSVENHGIAPDIEAVRSPVEWAEGRPSVLERAVRTALDLLERHPAAVPPDYARVPDLSRPALPPRG
ncbi:peptidase S41 [Streptomyces abyssalis]|uniref:Peptidase S41 n=1 Tax=Streptomyces abyssalis TaxID=933944 RepID=A0A1E7JMX0_9ACTN|nr:S41 family peptidase [Streptomyces abyssalis]OEU87022.1 peptidase S41 [Streptomyces abyssalis]OEU89593.1 peptidase S41 [Streptomyces abyssalis]